MFWLLWTCKIFLFKWLLLNELELHGWLFVNFHCSILLAKSLFEISKLTIWMISCKYLSLHLDMFVSKGEAKQVDDVIIHSFTICFSMVFLNTQKMNIMISVSLTFVKMYLSIPRLFGSSYPSLGNMIKVGQDNGDTLGKVQIAMRKY